MCYLFNKHLRLFLLCCRHKCHLKFSWTIPITYIVEAKIGLVSGFSHNVDMNPNVEMHENSDTGTQKKYPTLWRACCDCSLETVCRCSMQEEAVPRPQHPKRWCPGDSRCLHGALSRLVYCLSQMHLLLIWQVSARPESWLISWSFLTLCNILFLAAEAASNVTWRKIQMRLRSREETVSRLGCHHVSVGRTTVRARNQNVTLRGDPMSTGTFKVLEE